MNINKYNIKYYFIEENLKKKLSDKNIKKFIRPKSASDLNINDNNLNKNYNITNQNPRKILSSNSLQSIKTTSNYFNKYSNKYIKQFSKDNISVTSDNFSRNTSHLNSLVSKIDKKDTNFFERFCKYKLLDKPKKTLHRQFTLNNLTGFKTKEKFDNLLISDDINTDDKTLTLLTLMSPRCNSSKKKQNNLNRQHSNLSDTLSINSIKKRLDDLEENNISKIQKNVNLNEKQLIEKSNDNINYSYNIGKNSRNKRLNTKKLRIKTFHSSKFLPRNSKVKILKLLFQRKETILSNKFLKNIKTKKNENKELVHHTESQQNFLLKLEKDIYDNFEINEKIEKKDKNNALFINNFEYDYFENLTTIEKIKMNEKIKEIFEKNIYSNHLIDHLKDIIKIKIKYINKFDRSIYKKYLRKLLYLFRLNFYINSITTSFLFETSLDMREKGMFYLLNNNDFSSNNKIKRLKSKVYLPKNWSQIIKEKKMSKSKTMVHKNYKYNLKDKTKINFLLNIANKKQNNFLFIKDYIYRDTLYQISLTENFDNRITYIKAKILSEFRKEKIKKEKEIEKINNKGITDEEDNYTSDDELPIKNKHKDKTKKFINQHTHSINNFSFKLFEQSKRSSLNNLLSIENKLLNYNIIRNSKKTLSTREILGDNLIHFFTHHRKRKKIIKPKRQKRNHQTIKMSSQSVINLFSSRNKLITLLKTNEIKAEILKNIGDNIYKRIFFHIKETNDYQIKRLIKNNIDYINMNYQDEYGDTFLLKAVKYNCSFEIIEFLLKLGSNPNIFNKQGNSPLHFSLSHGNFKITNLLLNHDADETHCNNEGLIPWQCINKNLTLDV